MLQDMDQAVGTPGGSDEQFRRSIVGQMRSEHALFLKLFCKEDGTPCVGVEFARQRATARRADAGGMCLAP
jgi:hypothetical protein